MSEATHFTLGHLARFQRGITWSKAQETPEPIPGAVPVLRIPNIQERLHTGDLIWITGVRNDALDQYAARKDWILMVGSNGNPARVGNCVLINEASQFLFASFLIGVELTRRDLVSPDYLFRVFRSPEVQRYISDDVQGSTGLSNINLARLKAKVIRLPTTAQQRRIAEILGTVDEVIEQTETLIAKQQQVKAGLMHDLFTRGVTATGQLRPPPAEAPHLYQASPLGPIPKEWSVQPLAQICELIKDGTHLPPARVADGPLLLSVQNMIGGQLLLTSSDTRISESFFAQMHKSWSLKPHDVLLAVVGATIGKVARVPESFPKFTLQRSVAVIRGRHGCLSNHYLYWFFLTPAFKILLWQRVNQTAQPGIYLDQIGKMEIPVPQSEAEQNAIGERFETIEASLAAETAHLAKLRQQKQGLMHDLLSARVPVPA